MKDPVRSVPGEHSDSAMQNIGMLFNRKLLAGALVTVLAYAGSFTAYTFIAPILTQVTGVIQRFKTAYYDYRYHVQDAFYSDGYEAQFGVQPTFVFLVASTTIECGRYPVEIFMMGEEAKLAGQQEYHRNLRTLSDCLNTDEWPAIKTLSLPRWAKEYAND